MKTVILILLTAITVRGGVITGTRSAKAYDELYRIIYHYDPTNRWIHGDNPTNVHYRAAIDIEHITFYASGVENRENAGQILGTYAPGGCEWHDDARAYLSAVMGWPYDHTNETLRPVPPPEPKPPDKIWVNTEGYTDAERANDLQEEMIKRGYTIRKLKRVVWALSISLAVITGIGIYQAIEYDKKKNWEPV